MVVYEVNIQVAPAALNSYRQWLGEHILKMLRFPGFIEASVFDDISNEELEPHIVVHYTVKSLTDLEVYLEKHAQSMRQEGIERFGEQIKAQRRILKLRQEYANS